MKFRYKDDWGDAYLENIETKERMSMTEAVSHKTPFKINGEEGVIRYITSYSVKGGHGEPSIDVQVFAFIFKKDFLTIRLSEYDMILELDL